MSDHRYGIFNLQFMNGLKRQSILYIFFLYLIFSTACNKNNFELKSGDLLFQVNESNTFTDAITTTTGRHQKLSFSHVAIVSAEGKWIFVIEAIPHAGVRHISLQNFLNSSAHTSSGKPLVSVYRLKKNLHVSNVVENAGKYIGMPYDSTFMPGNNALYCSELVYESYLDTRGLHIFAAKPMSFKDSTGLISTLWINYFKKLGKAIPEGVPGTNPNALSKEKIIKEVYRYF